MFTHYLTYSFALNFQREIFLSKIDAPTRQSLHESADRMVRQLADAVKEGQDLETRAKAFVVSILCLRDCKDLLERSPQGFPPALRGPYEVLHGRLERLCEDANSIIERNRRTGLKPVRTASVEK